MVVFYSYVSLPEGSFAWNPRSCLRTALVQLGASNGSDDDDDDVPSGVPPNVPGLYHSHFVLLWAYGP